MSKRIRVSIALTIIFFLTAPLFVFQADAATGYYSNSFDSAAALDDGYWSTHDAAVQTVDNANVLKVTGEASFIPEHGNYDLTNFTVQFDVWHNVQYENNSAFAGPFYAATDSENKPVITMGYVQRGTDDVLTQQGFLQFNDGSSHYYFPFGRSAEWSTWRLTATVRAVDGAYFADVTLQVDNVTITDFTNDFEQKVSSITNESIRNPIAYHNLLPLPQPGVMIPTYSPTHYSSSELHFDLLSNTQAKTVASSTSTPSYVDNFYYGYANTVPLSSTPTSNPTSTATEQPTVNTGPEPPQAEPFPTTTVAIALAVAIVVIAVGVLAYRSKSKQKAKQP